MIYGIVNTGYDVPYLVTGLVLIGIVPIEDALSKVGKRKR